MVVAASTQTTDFGASPHRCMQNAISIHPQSWSRIIKAIDTTQEFGGNFFYDKQTNSLKIDDSTVVHGEFDNVVIPHGRYEFHTHPSKCKGSVCALGIPSVADIVIHLEDVNKDTLAHFVFEKHGMWVMTPSTTLRGEGKDVKRAIAHVHEMKNTLSSRTGTIEEYETLRNKWLHSSKRIGIRMVFIPHTIKMQSPIFNALIKC